MKKILFTLTIIISSLIANITFAETVSIPENFSEVRNYYKLNKNIATGGSFYYSDSSELKKGGFKTILDIRTVPEGTLEEQEEVTASGMIYNNLPITGNTAFNDENIELFTKMVDNAEKPMLIHCGSGNRVGMLYGQYLINKGVNLEEAISIGKRMGMRSEYAEIMRHKYSK